MKLPAVVRDLLVCVELSSGDVQLFFRRPADVEGGGGDIDRALLNLREKLADHIIAINDAIDMRKGH